MQYTAWVTLASVLMYGWIVKNVGSARVRYQVKAPSIDGPIQFQSILRVQANTVEQMVMHLPSLWLSAYFFSDMWAAILGAIWLVGRVVYALSYYQAPEKRSLGFGIGLFATTALLVTAGYGLAFHHL